MSITKESAFESNIEWHLLAHDWQSLAPTAYDRKSGIFGDEVIAFVRETQPKQWERLVTRHGGEATAREKFLKVVVDALDHRERDGAVPNRPQPERPDLPGPDAGALRGRPPPSGDDDAPGP